MQETLGSAGRKEVLQRTLSDQDIYDVAKNPTPDQTMQLAFEGAIRRALLKEDMPPSSLTTKDQEWARDQFIRFVDLSDYLQSVRGQEVQIRQRLMWQFPEDSEADWDKFTPIMEAQSELGLIKESIIQACITLEPSQIEEDIDQPLPYRLRKEEGIFKKALREISYLLRRPREEEPQKDPLIEEAERMRKSIQRPPLLILLDWWPVKGPLVIGGVTGGLALVYLLVHSGLQFPSIIVSGQSPNPGETLVAAIPEDLKTVAEVTPQPTSPPNPTVEDFLSQQITIYEGESLWTVLREQANSFGVGWINPENGITKGDVVADLVSKFMKKKGLNPNQMRPGQAFSWVNLDQKELELIKAALDTQSVADYQENVEPEARKLLP